MQIPHNLVTTAGEELDGVDHDLSDLSVRGVKGSVPYPTTYFEKHVS